MTRGEEECPESESDVKNSYVVIYSGSFFILLLLQLQLPLYSMVSSWMAQKTISSAGTTMIDTYVYFGCILGRGKSGPDLTTTD